MAITPAVKARVSKLMNDLESAHGELVKTNPAQITLEQEFEGTEAQDQASEALGGLQNMLVVWTPKIEEFYNYIADL